MAVVMAVNIQSPLDGITATISRWRLRRTKALLSVFAASLSALLLVPAIVVCQIQLALLPLKGSWAALVQAGMIMLASYVRLSASGYWNIGLGSQSLTPTISSLLCDSVIIETNDSISIPFIPYIVLLLAAAIVIVVSYADWYLTKVSWWRDHSTNWSVHYPEPMLRRLTEVIRGKVIDGSPMDEWPLVEDGTLGPDVIECDGAKRFDLAPAVVSKDAEASEGEVSTPERDTLSSLRLRI